MPSDKNEPIRITGCRFAGVCVVLVDLIKSVGLSIYTTSDSDALVCKKCALVKARKRRRFGRKPDVFTR